LSSSWRYLGSAAGFGFGVMWMTVGVGSAILVLLCAALGYGIVYIAERERAGSTRLRPASDTLPLEDPVVDDFELDHFERRDEELPIEKPARDEMALVSTEADYGWPTG
jgi:Small integral membrane protein (DUF2273)